MQIPRVQAALVVVGLLATAALPQLWPVDAFVNQVGCASAPVLDDDALVIQRPQLGPWNMDDASSRMFHYDAEADVTWVLPGCGHEAAAVAFRVQGDHRDAKELTIRPGPGADGTPIPFNHSHVHWVYSGVYEATPQGLRIAAFAAPWALVVAAAGHAIAPGRRDAIVGAIATVAGVWGGIEAGHLGLLAFPAMLGSILLVVVGATSRWLWSRPWGLPLAQAGIGMLVAILWAFTHLPHPIDA